MKPSEKRLLTLFLAVLVFAGLAIGINYYKKKYQGLKAERRTLELEEIEIDELLEKHDFWIARRDWLDSTQPQFTTQGQIKNQIYEDAKAEDAEGVTITNIQLVEEVETPHYIQAGATVTATGSLEAVFGWIHQLQKPEAFRVISDLRIQPDKEDDSVIKCSFSLLRWYAPSTSNE